MVMQIPCHCTTLADVVISNQLNENKKPHLYMKCGILIVSSWQPRLKVILWASFRLSRYSKLKIFLNWNLVCSQDIVEPIDKD